MDILMNTLLKGTMTLQTLLILMGAALVLGMLNALLFCDKRHRGSGLALALMLLPMAVTVVIMLVNGNIGMGLTVAGAFALVRFRSLPGTAKEIAAIFISMAMGLALGMGYVGIACLLMGATALAVAVMKLTGFGEADSTCRQLRITIQEDMDYNTLFDDVFETHHVKAKLVRVKSTAMGTLFDLTYEVRLASDQVPKALIDDLRARNGNLTVMFGVMPQEEML